MPTETGAAPSDRAATSDAPAAGRRPPPRRAARALALIGLAGCLGALSCVDEEADFLDIDLTPPDFTPADARLVAADPQRDHGFGYAVALEGDLAFVGAYLDDVGGGPSGAVYVYERDAGDPTRWAQTRKINAPGARPRDDFGRSLAYSNGMLAVGAWRNDDTCASDDPDCNAGAVWLFGRDQGGADSWGPILEVLPDDPAAHKGFGYVVAIDGDTLAVGAPADDDLCFVQDFGCDSGAVYLFERDLGGADAWGQVDKRVASSPAEGALFGRSVALEIDGLVVGAPSEPLSCQPGPSCQAGAVYVLERDAGGAGAWGEVARLTPPELEIGDGFGIDVAIEGDLVVVGAPGEDDACPSARDCDSGAVHAFDRNRGGADAWGHVKKLGVADAAADRQLGVRIGLSAGRLVAGAWGDSEAGLWAGAGYLFERDLGGADNWGQLDKLIAEGVRANDWFGLDVAIDGDTLAIGSILDDAPCSRDRSCDSGAVYVFTLP